MGMGDPDRSGARKSSAIVLLRGIYAGGCTGSLGDVSTILGLRE